MDSEYGLTENDNLLSKMIIWNENKKICTLTKLIN